MSVSEERTQAITVFEVDGRESWRMNSSPRPRLEPVIM